MLDFVTFDFESWTAGKNATDSDINEGSGMYDNLLKIEREKREREKRERRERVRDTFFLICE